MGFWLHLSYKHNSLVVIHLHTHPLFGNVSRGKEENVSEGKNFTEETDVWKMTIFIFV